MNDIVENEKNTNDNSVKMIYILYLAGVVFGITGIIGVIMAYINKKDSPEWLKSHYRFQIRTFWIGFLYLFVGVLLSVVVIGWLVILFWIIWLIIRSVKGMNSLDKKEAHPNPTGWMF